MTFIHIAIYTVTPACRTSKRPQIYGFRLLDYTYIYQHRTKMFFSRIIRPPALSITEKFYAVSRSSRNKTMTTRT